MKQFNLEEYLKNPKRVVTRDGREVRIICTDFNNNTYPIIIEVKDMLDPVAVTREGWCIGSNMPNDLDLFFASEKHERWINLYKWDNSTRYYVSKPFDSEEEAMEFSRKDDNYLKTLKIEWEE